MRVLVCDDDKDIVKAIGIYLRNDGYEVSCAYDGREALQTLEKQEVHLVIMDIMMNGMDGITAVRRLREQHNIPVILLSAKSEDLDKIEGLSVGADDYVTKPFNPMVLMARVRSQLRRYTSLGGMDIHQHVFRTGGLEIDDECKQVRLDGQEVKLTPIEYGILAFLTENAGRVFSIDRIYEAVWKEPGLGMTNTVTVHIRRIREKIEIDPKEPKYLKVVWGVGYKIEKI